MIDDLPPLREVVARHGLDAKKTLGQNFLFDLNLTSRIARAAGPFENTVVVEIGPGPGGLTRALLAQGAHVVAIERDQRCLPALAEIAERYPGRLTVVEGDALEIDVVELVRRRPSWRAKRSDLEPPSGSLIAPPPTRNDGDAPRARICANLPYNVATALLTRWIEAEPWPAIFDRYVLMFQKEVALRIVATPAQRADYGRLGVLCGWRTKARILFDVSPAAFTPPPKITSSVVELVPNPAPLACDKAALARVTQAAFGQRRKMLRQSLKGLGVDAGAMLAKAGIEETRRAEEIDVAGFVALANALSAARGRE
ncbi:16S rRNA (adenine(1518)-N(6)/adenine(1519)-N(6))-dimethyltransferase RsmA [Methylocystis parvus]|uniref:Ribosomal RNA small subunit methyltransferase A n=1 Tax=Methylocystis parvus TaxID=134 RepID=A0A6B8M8L3_9HYPH|nr:16S rRNA (adenine(1518)-N(6)/adenine(1519)-N(6))-dimethyltransferase RsmA [Methylocystis parvus]QGM97060.1 ribosomal RNA small subunit methyltransferase A [Methylocystis parvus]WBJ99040.1 16S rRNA (adenine(1518)-N(6)/adenine(1519)-N(6))-dimethyltransferase RsmA [Methylocystis parvus OBBP]